MSCKIKLNKISVSALFESNINKQFLVEEYHITRIFDEVVKDIINLLNNINTNNYVYSGWCFDNKNYQCIKSEQEIYHPIYVKSICDKDDLDELHSIMSCETTCYNCGFYEENEIGTK